MLWLMAERKRKGTEIMVPLNVDIPAETYARIYSAKGKTREPIRLMVLKWIERGLMDLDLGDAERLRELEHPPEKKPKPRR